MSHVVARGLTKRYEGSAAVIDASFELPRGKLLTFLGPSGSGKTTTLMMIAGFVDPDAGTVQVAGTEITRLPANKRGLGVVFQSHALFPHKSVFDNVAFPLQIRRMPSAAVKPRVERLLNLVQLGAFAERNVTTLSGGQKQRVALARALVFEPALLLMDEPLAALDRKLREQMQIEIKNLQRALDVTAILVTHDQEEAMMMSDIIAVMNGGRIVQIGTPTQLYEEPVDRFVAEFLSGVNLFPVHSTKATGGGELLAAIGSATRVPCRATGSGAAMGKWVGIRPERVRVCTADATEAHFTARVVRRTYLGSNMLYELQSELGTAFVAKVALDGEDPVFDAGTTVGITWMPRSAWLLS